MKQLIGAFSNPKKGKENVILVEKVLDDKGNLTKDFTFIEDPLFKFWKSKEPKEVYETSVKIEDVSIVSTKYSNLSKKLAELTNRESFYDKCMQSNRRDLQKLHFNKDIHLSDIHILDYLIYDFYQNNRNDVNDKRVIPLHKAFFDIEVDTSSYDGFPEPDIAPCPINFISHVDAPTKVLKLYILLNEKNNKSQREFIAKNKGTCTNYWTSDNNEWCAQALEDYFIDNKDSRNTMEKMVIYWHKTEMSLVSKFYSDLHKTRFDFLGGWNTYFDVKTIEQRLIQNEIDPREVMCPPEFPVSRVNIREDNYSANLDDKNDTLDITGWGNTVDLRYYFLAKRKGQGKRDSTKLGDILLEELGEGKIELEDSIKDAVYTDFENFLLYSAFDSYRLMQLETKNTDIDLMHMMSSMLYTRHSKVMRKNICIRNLAAHYFQTQGRVLSNNQNKFIEHEDFGKFKGAFVADSNLLNNVGVMINGHQSNTVFDDTIDEDFTGLYPAIISTFQIGDMPLIGKILFGAEGDAYLEEHYGELLNEKHIITIGERVFNMPSFGEILGNVNTLLND